MCYDPLKFSSRFGCPICLLCFLCSSSVPLDFGMVFSSLFFLLCTAHASGGTQNFAKIGPKKIPKNRAENPLKNRGGLFEKIRPKILRKIGADFSKKSGRKSFQFGVPCFRRHPKLCKNRAKNTIRKIGADFSQKSG